MLSEIVHMYGVKLYIQSMHVNATSFFCCELFQYFLMSKKTQYIFSAAVIPSIKTWLKFWSVLKACLNIAQVNRVNIPDENKWGIRLSCKKNVSNCKNKSDNVCGKARFYLRIICPGFKEQSFCGAVYNGMIRCQLHQKSWLKADSLPICGPVVFVWRINHTNVVHAHK